MAIVTYTKSFPDSLNAVCGIITWANLANGDEGQPIELANFADRSVQINGTFGVGGSVAIKGSIDGTNYYTLTDPQGNDLNITTAKIEAVTELVRYLKPVVTGDGSTSLTVTMIARGATR